MPRCSLRFVSEERQGGEQSGDPRGAGTRVGRGQHHAQRFAGTDHLGLTGAHPSEVGLEPRPCASGAGTLIALLEGESFVTMGAEKGE